MKKIWERFQLVQAKKKGIIAKAKGKSYHKSRNQTLAFFMFEKL